MRVRMKTTMAGPGGTTTEGKVVDLPAWTAAELIDGGYAEAVKDAAIETASKVQPETAARTGRARGRNPNTPPRQPKGAKRPKKKAAAAE